MRIYFHHIIKTAGSSVRGFLVERLGERNVSPPLRNARFREALRDYARYAAIAGHIVVDPGDVLPDDRVSVVFLRDPVERTLSQFSFMHTAHPFGRTPRSPAVNDVDGWLDVLAERERRALNAQLDCIWAYGWRDGDPSPTPAQKIDAAKRALEQFDVIGLQEHFDASIDRVAHRCGWTPPSAAPRANVTPVRLAQADLSDRALGRLHRYLEPDYEVYRHALMLFGRQRHARTFVLRGGEAPDAIAVDAKLAAARVDRSSNDVECKMSITGVTVNGQISGPGVLQVGETVAVDVRFASRVREDRLTVSLSIHDAVGTLLFGTGTRILGENLAVSPGEYIASFKFANHLGLGSYRVSIALHREDSPADGCFDRREAVARFEVVDILTEDFVGRIHLSADVSVIAASPAARVDRTPNDGSGNAGFWPLRRRNPALRDFRATLAPRAELRSLPRASDSIVRLDVRNRGSETWHAFGRRAVYVSYHWLGPGGAVIERDGLRTALPRDLAAGESITVDCLLRAPDSPGEATLVWTLVQEELAWFDTQDPDSQFRCCVSVLA